MPRAARSKGRAHASLPDLPLQLGMVPPAYSDKPQEGMQRVRVTYVITPEQRLALSWTYPASVGGCSAPWGI